MALESVFAKALPKVGLANKDTQNGEMESADSHPDDEVCAADLEEGEIVDSGHEDSDDPQPAVGGGPSGKPSGAPPSLVRGPPLPPQEALRPPFTKLEKRKRKKRKKDDQGGGPDAKQKRAHYVDHDRMADDTVWFSPESGGGLLHGPPMHHPPHQGGGGGGGGPMSARDFGSPHPYDDSYMPLALLEERLALERLCASPAMLEEVLNGGLRARIRPCHIRSPPQKRGCGSPPPDGGECLDGLPQECLVGPPHRGGGGGAFPGRGGGRGGRGKPPFMVDMRRPGAPPKKKKKKNKMSARGGGGGKRDGPPKRSVCKFYLDNKCNKGADCPFSHDAPLTRKADLCKFYLGGYCARGEHCSFMHQDFPCKFFHTGATCFADASCRFSHQPLTDETRRLLHRYLDNCGGRMDDDMLPPGGGPDCLDFPPDDGGRAGAGQPPGEDFGGPCAKRPSLLGSPPRHVKEAAETWRMQFLGGGGGPMRGPAPPFGPPQGPGPVMSPPRGFPSRPSFYMETMSMSPVRGSLPPAPPPGASPPQRGGPCLDEGFAAPLGASAMGGGLPLPHGRSGGFGSPAGISSPPLQDQGTCGPGGIAPNPGMSPLGVFFDPSQDQPMSPPSQQQQQCIPGLNLAGPLSPPHNQAAPAAAQIPPTDASSDQPHRSPQPPHHDDQDGGSSDDSHCAPSEKKVLPPNLPRRQRELFMRIQQQQRTAETTAAAEAADAAPPTSGAIPAAAAADQAEAPAAAAKPEPARIASLLANDESSSDDDEDYDPLTAVLKKLQQQAPVDSRNSSSASVAASSASMVATPSPLAVPSMAGLDIARMLSNLRQVPSEPQTNFWKQLFSGVSAATAAVAATSAAETTPAPCPPAVSRDPRRARAEAQLAKQTEQPPTSRDPRLRDKPPPAPKVLETAFVESKDGDVPYKLTSILRALPKYDDVVRGGAIPESKLKSDPRLAKYMGQKPPEPVVAKPVVAAPAILATPPVEAALKLAATLPLPAVSALLKPPTVVNRRDPRMARHLEQALQQQPPPTESKPLIAELPKLTPPPLPVEVVPKADPRKAAALAANGGTGTQRVDPRLARRLEQQKAAAASPSPSEPPPPPPPPPPRLAEETAMNAGEEQAKPKPTARRGRGQPGKPRGNADGRKNRMDYASPLSTYDSEVDRPSGYSSYQRRPQPRPPVLPADAMPPPPPPPPPPKPAPVPALISDDLLFQADQAMKSLKDVFKTKDPTASPFC